MRPNLAVLSYLVVITAVTGCLAGLAPAAESLRTDLSSGARGRDAVALAGTRWRMRDLLIAGQVAMSLVLLVGAVLFTRAESAIRHSDAGLDTEHTLVMPVRGVAPAHRQMLMDRVGAIPGVRSVALADASPLDVELMPTALVRRADQADSMARRSATMGAVSPGYFETLRMPAVRGHVLSRAMRRTTSSSRSRWRGRWDWGKRSVAADRGWRTHACRRRRRSRCRSANGVRGDDLSSARRR